MCGVMLFNVEMVISFSLLSIVRWERFDIPALTKYSAFILVQRGDRKQKAPALVKENVI